MKRKSITVLLALAALQAGAQSKLDLQSRLALRAAQTEQTARRVSATDAQAEADHVKVLVRMKPGCDAAALRQAGFEVGRTRGEFAVVTLAADEIDSLNANAAVESISYAAAQRTLLDRATADTGVDDIHLGSALDMPYTGKGAVVAVLDRWLDPNHPMLCDPDTRKSRVKMLFTDDLQLLDTPEKIAAYSPSQSERGGDHGTHVTGIAAGSYDNGTFSCKGVAPEADILMGYVTEKPALFMEMVEAFIDYAKAAGKPLVVNMSVGRMTGPHDGTSSLSAYIDKVCADGDATFCIAAGNYGKFPSIQKHTFAADGEEMKSFIRLSGDNDEFEAWADDNRKFDAEFVLYDLQENKALITYTLGEGRNSANFTPMTESAELAGIYVGDFFVERGISSANNRYNYYLYPKGTVVDPSRYIWGYIFKGNKGQSVTVTTSPYPLLVSRGVAGWGEGILNGVTNDFGSGTGPLVVGSYTTRDSGTYADGTAYSTSDDSDGEKNGEISPFSSYATYDTGRSYPHLCAPGSFVVSASNTYYMENTGVADEAKKYVAKVSQDGRDYYFRAMQGTSMATPFMTGVAALWLEADPKLTAERIRDIAVQTARRDPYVESSANQTQWGAGKVDAYAGMKKVVADRTSGLSAVDADHSFMFRRTDASQYEFFLAGATSVSLTAYNTQGQPVASASAPGDTATLSTQGLPRGVYAVKVHGAAASHTVKIVVE